MPFIELQSVDSTNNYAFARIHAGMAQHGEVIFAREQWAGKGQMGKAWQAENDANIMISIILKPASLGLSAQPDFNFAVACGVHDFFSRYGGDATRIKWPNDLYWQDRKAGGVLVESVVGSPKSVDREKAKDDRDQVTGNSAMVWEWAIVGIGININQVVFPEHLPNPVSLKQITGKNFDPLELSKELAASVKAYTDRVMQGETGPVYEHYLSCLYKKDEKVKLKKGTRVFEAIVRSVNPSGQLVVQTSMEECFDSGTIEWVNG
jgi:BirA family biotin operon repressor/biotin-[acetyl-CoA-carboxylase] ligase